MLYGFQFLIGTIKTFRGMKDDREREKMFQFLIGTIKTYYAPQPDTSLSGVSIPHRYDQNLKEIQQWKWKYDEFQFLIGTIKTDALVTGDAMIESMFQFLIGTIKTLNRSLDPEPCFSSFNSS